MSELWCFLEKRIDFSGRKTYWKLMGSRGANTKNVFYSAKALAILASAHCLTGKSQAAVVATGLTGDQTSELSLYFLAVSGGLSLSNTFPGSGDYLQVTDCGGIFYGNASGGAQFWSPTSSNSDISFDPSAAPTVDISTNGGYISGFGVFGPVASGQRLAFGWRIPNAGGFNYGWTEVERGSVIHNQSFVNDTLGGGISIGAGAAVPEPTSVALLALGGVGLAAQRRRRRRASEK